jgi:hypothetical protein
MKKRLFSVLAMLCLTLSVNASVFKLADVLVNSVELKRKIVQEGISGPSINRLKSYIDTSVESLTNESFDLVAAVRALRVTGPDADKKARLLRTLRQDASAIKNEEFIDSVNDLIFLADRYGVRSSSTLSCSVCVTDQLGELGVTTSIRKVGGKDLTKHLKRIPKSPRSLVLFNKKLARKLKVEDEFKYLKENEYKAMAFFLQIADKSDGSFKKLSKSILDFNKQGGKVHLAGPKANSKLWKIFTTTLSEEKANRFADVISLASKQKTPAERKAMFYKELERLAGKSDDKLDKVETIKSKDCFFK